MRATSTVAVRLVDGEIDCQPSPVEENAIEKVRRACSLITQESDPETEVSELSEQDLADPKRLGMRRALKWSADDYFIGGDDDWQEFVRDHYDNFYCSYFASRLVRGRKEIATLPREAQILRALKGLQDLDAVYGTTTLRRLERDILSVTGQRIRVVGRLSNAAKGSKPRWPQLVSALQTPEARARVEEFVATDLELLDRFHRTEARGKPRNWLQLFKRSR